MQVNKIIAIGLIITNIMFLFSSSAQAQNRKISVECNAALQRAKKQIQKNQKNKHIEQIVTKKSKQIERKNRKIIKNRKNRETKNREKHKTK